MVSMKLVLIIALLAVCSGDVYIHNPRGCNNRLNEDTRPRTNANRLFNSENNKRGGYNVGVEQMYYYSGSHLEIQWSNQHSCNDQNNNCEIVLQYMCGPQVRDGTKTTTIPDTLNADTDKQYGRHESFVNYQKCKGRQRNKGLFTDDQRVIESATGTRQTANGERFGYECTEERDYYPYWVPSPWKDIAILTNNVERCEYYRKESQNVKEVFACVFDEEYWKNPGRQANKVVLFNDKTKCENSRDVVRGRVYTGRWEKVKSRNLPPPDCLQSVWSRDNHQGNTYGGEFAKYDWVIPEVEDEENCVVRIRYNISTNDYDSWAVDASDNGNSNPSAIWERFDFNRQTAKTRQYILKNNPQVDVFNLGHRRAVRYQVNINTNNWGRTFEDRSHVFKIRKRPSLLADEVIHNVNVRGKRGNIVQTYPAVEYDFVPTNLYMTQNEYVHFQWTGSNNNPANNAGNGKAKTDRNNVVKLIDRKFPEGFDPRDDLSLGTNYPSHTFNLLGLNRTILEDLAFLGRGSDPQLDNRNAYFDLPPKKISHLGTYYYMCTRNNDFSNRDQKAAIYVGDTCSSMKDLGASYQGYISTTVSGRQCQRWNHQYPHAFSYDPIAFYFLGVQGNFCRNPDRRALPWCFTNDPNVPWEYCNVPICPGTYASTDNHLSCKTTESGSSVCPFGVAGDGCVGDSQNLRLLIREEMEKALDKEIDEEDGLIDKIKEAVEEAIEDHEHGGGNGQGDGNGRNKNCPLEYKEKCFFLIGAPRRSMRETQATQACQRIGGRKAGIIDEEFYGYVIDFIRGEFSEERHQVWIRLGLTVEAAKTKPYLHWYPKFPSGNRSKNTMFVAVSKDPGATQGMYNYPRAHVTDGVLCVRKK